MQRIIRSKRYVFLRQDFCDIASYDQIGRALRILTQESKLLKIGYGLYTKAKINPITGKVMPTCPEGADAVLLEALKRLGVNPNLDTATQNYLNGRTNQIPAFTKIETPRRFTRQLSIGRSQING